MIKNMPLWNLYLISLTLLLFNSCQKNDESVADTSLGTESETQQTIIPAINDSLPNRSLQNAEGCLSIPAMVSAITSLDSRLDAVQITTHFAISSEKRMRREFRALASYSAFAHGKIRANQIAELPQFEGLTQNQCKFLTANMSSGEQIKFSISLASPDTIKAKDNTGREIQFRWLTPKSIALKIQYTMLDLPCTDTEAVVEVEKVFVWGSDFPNSIDKASPFYIDSVFLKSVADAVGINFRSLYLENTTSDAESSTNGPIITAKIEELSQMPIRPELLACHGDLVPDPTEIPTLPTHP